MSTIYGRETDGGICVAFCPKQVLEVDELGKVQVVNKEACIVCGQCELRCPDYAIFVDKGGATA